MNTVSREDVGQWAIRFECYWCRAKAGETCKTAAGNRVAGGSHAGRLDRAHTDLMEPHYLERVAQKYIRLAKAAVTEWQSSRRIEQVATAIRIADQPRWRP